jgi:hypothetical protein
VTRESPTVNHNTCGSRVRSRKSSRIPVGRNDHSRSRPKVATRMPADPPSTANTPLSASNWRMSLHLGAPTERRTAISLRRSIARASSRLATLPQAISSTSPVAASSSPPERTRLSRPPTPSTACVSGKSSTLRPSFSVGYCSSRRFAMVFMACRALSNVTPGCRRPTTWKDSAFRAV